MSEQMIERWYFHDYDEETGEGSGMEYWHDGEWTRGQCHDGVGLMTYHHQSLADFLKLCPNAHELEDA